MVQKAPGCCCEFHASLRRGPAARSSVVGRKPCPVQAFELGIREYLLRISAAVLLHWDIVSAILTRTGKMQSRHKSNHDLYCKATLARDKLFTYMGKARTRVFGTKTASTTCMDIKNCIQSSHEGRRFAQEI